MTDIIMNPVTIRSINLAQYEITPAEIIIGSNEPKISFAWHNICVDVLLPKPGMFKRLREGKKENQKPFASTKQILNNVNGNISSGTLIALMGASGAGKSTLLKVLSGCPEKTYKIKGTIMVNNKMVDYKARKYMGFVQQDDIFIGTLTVRQHLIIQAGLQMPKTSLFQRTKRVEDILFQLNLIKAQNTLIGIPGRVQGLSGGELRRLSIATELLKDPNILFADEPTTGLDSYMAKSIVLSLRKLADQGKIVICTIHQPSSETFEMFDQLYLLAEGINVYSGSSKNALKFFEQMGYPCPINYNPADHYISTLAIIPGEENDCKQRVQKFIQKFKGTHSNDENTDCKIVDFKEKKASVLRTFFGSSSKATFFNQFNLLLMRAWMSSSKDPALTTVKILQSIIISMVIALIFLRNSDGSYHFVEDYNGALFLSITNMTFGSVLGVIFVFPLEFVVFTREKRKGLYRTSAYFVSRTLADIPINILTVLIYSTIFYWIIGFYNDVRSFLTFFMILLIVSETAKSWGYFISSITSTVHTASTLSTPLMIPFLIFGGLFIRDSSIPIYFIWIRYLSWFKYSYESLIINQYQYITTGLTFNGINNLTGISIIKGMGYNINNLYVNCAIMFSLMLGFRMLALFCLIIRSNYVDN